jgi:hypothetical protein
VLKFSKVVSFQLKVKHIILIFCADVETVTSDTPRKIQSPRQQVFMELVQTESNYVGILHTIVSVCINTNFLPTIPATVIMLAEELNSSKGGGWYVHFTD